MALALLKEPPLAPDPDLGPYRREDYAALPDEPRCELIYGRFYVCPSPLVLHQAIVLVLAKFLDQTASTVGGRVFFAPLDVHLADHSAVQPDVIYISAARRPIIQDWIEGAPDLLVEVLSPGTARRDRVAKLGLYAESGVREYWIVDPHERHIEHLVNEGGRFVVSLPDGPEYCSRNLPEIHLDLLLFWKTVDEKLR
jgi:Uma2 family endonuclease